MQPNQKNIERIQLSTFEVGGRSFGIDVRRVQEIVRSLPVTPLPLAPAAVVGMINLRGQIATAVTLSQLLQVESKAQGAQLNVVCKSEGALLTFLVDEIGDVVEVKTSDIEEAPATLPGAMRRLLSGVVRCEQGVVSILNVDLVLESLNQRNVA